MRVFFTPFTLEAPQNSPGRTRSSYTIAHIETCGTGVTVSATGRELRPKVSCTYKRGEYIHPPEELRVEALEMVVEGGRAETGVAKAGPARGRPGWPGRAGRPSLTQAPQGAQESRELPGKHFGQKARPSQNGQNVFPVKRLQSRKRRGPTKATRGGKRGGKTRSTPRWQKIKTKLE